MKNNDKKELFAKSKAELLKLLKSTRDELSGIKLDKAQNKLKNTRNIFNLRKKIAVILTIIKQKEMIKNG